MSKGAFIKGMNGCSQKLQYTNTVMEKNKQGEGVGLRMMNFQE